MSRHPFACTGLGPDGRRVAIRSQSRSATTAAAAPPEDTGLARHASTAFQLSGRSAAQYLGLGRNLRSRVDLTTLHRRAPGCARCPTSYPGVLSARQRAPRRGTLTRLIDQQDRGVCAGPSGVRAARTLRARKQQVPDPALDPPAFKRAYAACLETDLANALHSCPPG